ncbi:MAG: type I-E CRISPR-associated protein Cas5/CasD [Ignavibacteria bacterium]|nr:type I-E CRISPR-associated protein Cas5/CasD [Ignavibacteria bacterium]
MATLLIELEGPMQSWGYRGKFSERDTGREPSKSGVLGIIAASLGRGRDEDVSDLVSLHFGVRADREGLIKKEFQTAQNIIRADGKSELNTKLVYRYYLANARFIAALEGELRFLQTLQQALLYPVYPQFLGRRSYVPSVPLIRNIQESVIEKSLEDALLVYPFKMPKMGYQQESEPKLRVVRDAREAEESPAQDYRHDVPISYKNKEYFTRKVITGFITPKNCREE